MVVAGGVVTFAAGSPSSSSAFLGRGSFATPAIAAFVASPQLLLFAARLFPPFVLLGAVAVDAAVKGIGIVGEKWWQWGVLDMSSSGWFLLEISVVVLLLDNGRCGPSVLLLLWLLPTALEQ
jgi:hypothetical protein